MKRLWKAAAPLAMSAGLLLSCLTASASPANQMKDLQGHWARATMEQACEDGILTGTSETTMSPNGKVTRAQAVTILCRILHVTGEGDSSALGIPEGAWYARDAARAVYLGLLTEADAGTLNQTITRGEALQLFCDTFQIQRARPDESVLNAFSDGPYLTGAVRQAAAALVQAGVINGIDGALKLDQPLSRAEFATILYRITDRFLPAETFSGGEESAGTVLSGDADLSGVTAGRVWFDQTASRIALSDASLRTAVIRSDQLDSLTLSGALQIGDLILAQRSGDVLLDVPDTVSISNLILGDGGGTVTVSGGLTMAEVTGDGRDAVLRPDSLRSLTISGNNNRITLDLPAGEVLDELTITGRNNTVILNSQTLLLQVEGRDNVISGKGRAESVSLLTRYAEVKVPHGSMTQWKNYSLDQVKVSLEAPASLPAGETLQAVAHLTFPPEDAGKLCTASWYLNGKLAEKRPVILGQGDPVSQIEVAYTHDLVQEAALEFVLSYENGDGDGFTRKASSSLYLETYDDLGLADAALNLSAPASLAPGEALSVSAAVTTPETGKICQVLWLVDGQETEEATLTLGGAPAHLTHRYDYYYGMPETSTVTCRVEYTTQDGREQALEESAQVRIVNYPDNGLARASVTLSAPELLPAGQQLTVTANVNYLQAGKACTAVWYVDGTQVSSQTVVLGQDVPQLNHKYTYYNGMSTASTVRLVLSCVTEDGREQEISAETSLTLQTGPSAQEAQKTVTSGYAGNYTLKWALEHDYTPEMKTAWVNAQGYASKSKYLVWVNLTYQRVNIFEGSQGNWTLIRQALCGSGKPSTPTIRGVFAVTYKQSSWNYGSYYCGPVVRFHGGYAFHSRLEYWPMGSGRYYDARIGFPISHGCLRMYDDDIWWIYNNIPNGTTVVVY